MSQLLLLKLFYLVLKLKYSLGQREKARDSLVAVAFTSHVPALAQMTIYLFTRSQFPHIILWLI